jgi:hypothetical protein
LDVTIDQIHGDVSQASSPAMAGRQACIPAVKPYSAE